MSFAASLQFPRPVAKGGRLPVALDPRQRRRHIKAAYYRLVEDRPVSWIARYFRVSVRTVYYWVEAALTYTDSEALILRSVLLSDAA